MTGFGPECVGEENLCGEFAVAVRQASKWGEGEMRSFKTGVRQVRFGSENFLGLFQDMLRRKDSLIQVTRVRLSTSPREIKF